METASCLLPCQNLLVGFNTRGPSVPAVPLGACCVVSPSLCPRHQPMLMEISTPHPTAPSRAVPREANPIHVLRGTGASSPPCAVLSVTRCHVALKLSVLSLLEPDAAPDVSRTCSEVVKSSWYQTPSRRAWRRW